MLTAVRLVGLSLPRRREKPDGDTRPGDSRSLGRRFCPPLSPRVILRGERKKKTILTTDPGENGEFLVFFIYVYICIHMYTYVYICMYVFNFDDSPTCG